MSVLTDYHLSVYSIDFLGYLIGYLTGVNAFVKQHIHNNKIVQLMTIFQIKIIYMQFNAQQITSIFIIGILTNIML